MVKLYLRYRLAASFGLVASGGSNSLFDKTGKYAITPALENVTVWDVRKGTLFGEWKDADNKAEVTGMTRSPSGEHIAVGYADGSIRVWELATGESAITFNGHRSAVTALSYDSTGARLVSGSKDTDVIVWDIVAESGLYRLRGHKDQVTAVRFLSKDGLDHVVSTSKDTLMKFWDLATQHCVETVIAHRGEVWDMDVSPDQTRIFTGAGDGEVRVWQLDLPVLRSKLEPAGNTVNSGWQGTETNPDGTPATKRAVVGLGTLERQSKERVVTLRVHPSGRYVGAQGSDRLVEVFRIRTEEEIKKKMARLKKRQKEKKTKGKGGKEEANGNDDEEEEVKLSVADEIPRVAHIRCSAKVRSFDFSPVSIHKGAAGSGKEAPLQILCALSNNSAEVHAVEFENKEQPTRLVSGIDIPGHRSDVRTLALAPDDELLLTGSSDMIKIWNVYSRQCLKTIESGYALCCEFLPGNNFVIIGTKTGELQLFDLARSAMIESIKAHDGPVWSLHMRADKKGFVTGSQDKDVKFWDLGFMEDTEYSRVQKRPTMVHTRTLKMADDVLCVRYSPDGRLLAISLLDSTVKVLYADTLKFFLSLYGHKLPVLSMDISSDSTLIVTGSSDKTIKIWGLDFGDCHKSLHAHQDSVMNVRFVFGTHYLFSVGKDRAVKYWDTDSFELIMTLGGTAGGGAQHHGEVWALAVAKYGNFVVTGAHDRSIRVWEKTDDQFMLEEEREKEMEEMYETTAADAADKFDAPVGSGIAADDPDHMRPDTGDNADEAAAPGKATAGTLKAGERLIEALDVWEEERRNLDAYERVKAGNPDAVPPPRSPFIVALNIPDITPEGYVLHVAQKIRASDLDEALLVLPFAKVVALLKNIVAWIDRAWNPTLTSRILFHLLRTHHHQLVSTATLRPTLTTIRRTLRAQLVAHREKVGFNLAGLRYWQNQLREQAEVNAFVGEDRFEDAANGEKEGEEKDGKGKSKRKRRNA
ncbi:WD40-repeat-containing domain protein [Fimicolochytrium jonesii]|uniref:WD40-repeat-containing domain protein n=1 Tax=Fimicolochytrium jonesii TaxID=1396493 RepID=UPI0022FDDF60|nr:WD40-repeat-containing domain protein [Fimicolochytrium jonesii]KAI8820199.1 WD40-repeat-containing domain protein [Fimicolochytrium jonesii]